MALRYKFCARRRLGSTACRSSSDCGWSASFDSSLNLRVGASSEVDLPAPFAGLATRLIGMTRKDRPKIINTGYQSCKLIRYHCKGKTQ
jgi:hypothetical protein